MAPGNDSFSLATNLDLTGTLPASLSGQTTFDATKEATEPALVANDQSVWYRVQPTVTGWYKFWIEADEQVDHPSRGLGMALGSPTTLAGYTASAVETRVEHPESFGVYGWWTVAGLLTSGNTYYVKVYSNRPGSINAQTSDFTIRWDVCDPPANDNFADAVPLTLPASVTVNTYDCTYEASEGFISPGFYSGMQGQWYTLTTASAGWYSIRLLIDDMVHTGNAIADPPSYVPGFMYCQVFAASVDTIAETTEANVIAVNSLSANSSSDMYIQFEAPSAGTYYIRVATPIRLKSDGDGVGRCFNNNAASTTMEVAAIPAPTNDDFADAEVVTTSPLVGTTYGATEEATEPSLWGTVDQSVWYEFSPPSDGDYMFAIDEDNVTSHATVEDNWELYWAVFDSAVVTTLADATYENMFPEIYNYTQMEFGNGYAAIICQGMLAANTYWIKVAGRMTSSFNARTSDFELDWVLTPPPDNDDFADAEAIGSATGNTTGTLLNSSVEGSEPMSFYWNDNPQTNENGTVWYDWTCPTTGDYVFKVESNETGSQQDVRPDYDLAIWHGATLAGLTKIARNWVGSQNTTGLRDNQAATAIGFHATSGQHYKIQVSSWEGSVLTAPDFKLSWRTNVVTGNTTATALAFPDGRTDNYGNDDTEPPPNFATILASHDSWWFDDGQVGGVKWFKRVFTGTEQVEIRGVQFDDSDYGTNVMSTGDIGLICYKGANYASLVVADESGTSDDAAMMVVNSDFLPGGIGGVRASFTNMSSTKDFLLIDCDPGDTLWIAIFGLVDVDPGSGTGTAEDATQFEIDVHVPTPPPGNDIWGDVWDDDTYLWNLSKDQYSVYWPYPEAGRREGLTLGATAEVGEGARAGFAATRSVWYYLDFWDYEDTRTWEFSLESDVDCVMGIYDVQDNTGEIGDLVLLLSDDDSGTGNTPLINYVPNDHYDDDVGTWGYLVVVDSKTEGAFTLNFRVVPTATPPANDDFADAVVISTIPSNVSGTTVGATVEFAEHTAEELSEGPRDTVWYKYVATFTGHVKVKATCDSDNDDGYIYVDTWHGTTLEELERHPDPPPSGPGAGINRGFYVNSDTPAEIDASAITLDVVNGETYYIRVQTESGGSEDFTLYVDLKEVYLNIQASGSEEMHGTLLDDAEATVNIQTSGVEDFHSVLSEDSATVLVDIQPSGSDFMAFQYTDATTIRVSFTIDSHDCQTKFDSSQLIAHSFERFEHQANHRWVGTLVADRFEVVAGDGLEEC